MQVQVEKLNSENVAAVFASFGGKVVVFDEAKQKALQPQQKGVSTQPREIAKVPCAP